MKAFVLTGQFGHSEIRLRQEQMTTTNISRHFKLKPETIYLKEQYGNNTEFSESGRWNLEMYEDGTTFHVLGDRLNRSSSPMPGPSHSIPPVPSSLPPRPTATTRKPICSVKIVRADLDTNGKPTNVLVHNASVHVNIYKENEANVDFILAKAMAELSDENVTENMMLVNSAGLIYYNQEGTKGTSFWRVSSRKIYLVPSADIEECKRTYEPDRKRKRKSVHKDIDSTEEEIYAMHTAIENIVVEMHEIKETLSSFHKLCFKHRFSLGFLETLESTLGCCICKTSPATPPVIGCKSCGSLIGCTPCVNQWYSGDQGMEKKCPHCRCDRGLANTFPLKGFENLFQEAKELLPSDDSGALDDTLPI